MKNIVLIGFMCSGKTTVGKALAKKLGWDCIDTDETIEKENGMKIPDIFEKKGEKEFRKMEFELVKRIYDKNNCVIAAGGGIPLNYSNVELLKKNGLLVELFVGVDSIIERVRKHKERRPLVRNKTNEEIKEMYNIREVCYKDADITVDVTKLNPEKAAEKIVNEVRKLH